MTAYKSYRLYMTLNSAENQGYFAVSEWRMYEDEEGTTPNLLVGGVSSASHTEGLYPHSNAFDGNESTTWESTYTPPSPKWLRYDLPEPVVVRSIYISHNRWGGERPKNFQLQGSNDDGKTWDLIAAFRNFLSTSVASRKSSLVRNIMGKSLLDDGTPVPLVRVYSWNSGQLLDEIVPDQNGSWEYYLWGPEKLLVVQYPPEGYRPIADGPISILPKW